jgi:antitoxin HigA-1
MSIPIEGGRLPPLHPGEVLREEFLRPLGLSAYALAKALHVPVNRITAILAGERAISADTALRLARFFGTTPQFWINLQGAHDRELARSEHGALIAAEVRGAAARRMMAFSPPRIIPILAGLRYECAMTAHHRSRTEGHVRKIRDAGRGESEGRKPLGSRIRARFTEIGLNAEVPELRRQPARPATFEK